MSAVASRSVTCCPRPTDELTSDLNQMVPGTASKRGPNMPASKWLTEMDKWSKKKYDGSLDICMNGVVCGVIEV